jgi:two-component system sensor histidine kinase YesM
MEIIKSFINRTRKYISSKFDRLQLSINNKKIKTKTIYLYVTCVLIPVVVTNTFIIGNVMIASRNDGLERIDNIVSSIANDIITSIESAVYITYDMYANTSICNFLDEQYDNHSDFFKEYNKIFDNYLFYSSSKQLISSITLFSDNSTMVNGGRFYRIGAIQSEDWYQKFNQSNLDLFIYPYYNNAEDSQYKRRMISVIRKLNYIELSSIEKIVKLDLNYEMINNTITNSAFDTKVYVCCDDKIIFSNDYKNTNLKSDFLKVSTVSMEEVQQHKSFTAYGFKFDIYLKSYKSDYAAIMKDKFWLLSILFLANALLPAIMLTLFSNSITKRVLYLGKYLKKVKNEEFDLMPHTEERDEIGELQGNYNLMVDRIKDLIEYKYKSRLEQQELHLARQQAELLALHSQINPHFMYNVLESIRMRSLIKEEHETSHMIESLARLMRKTAEWGEDLISLRQELEFTEDFLNLQKYRYGNGLNYKFRINEDCYSFMIPSLVLVTFVENSCIHGLNREGNTGTIFISAYREGTSLYIEVEDTGIGMKEEQVQRLEKLLNEADITELQKSNSLGMLNACIRLKKYCGIKTRVTIESETQVGTCIIIKIPIENL